MQNAKPTKWQNLIIANDMFYHSITALDAALRDCAALSISEGCPANS
jgi:hypothetical protein